MGGIKLKSGWEKGIIREASKWGAWRDVRDCVCEGSGWVPRDSKMPIKCPYHLTPYEIDGQHQSDDRRRDGVAFARMIDRGSESFLPVGEQQEILDGLAGSDEDFIAQYVGKQQ